MTAQCLCNSIQEVPTPQIKKTDDIKVRKNSAVNIQKKGHQNYLVAFFYSSLARKGIFNVVLPWLHFFRKKSASKVCSSGSAARYVQWGKSFSEVKIRYLKLRPSMFLSLCRLINMCYFDEILNLWTSFN